MLKISDNCQENTYLGASLWIEIGLSSRLDLYLSKRTLWYRYFAANFEKHLTTILQFSWMINLALHYSEAVVHRFSQIGVFKSFVIFAEKHLCRNFFLIMPQNWRLVFWIKKDSRTGASSEYWETFKNSFFYRKLPVAASYYSFCEHLLFEI